MKGIAKKILSGVTALGLLFSVTACGGTATSGVSSPDDGSVTAAAYAYLAIDINPSVEIVVKDGKVESVRAANDDASVLLSGEDLVGLTVAEATDKIVALAERMGYLNEGNKSVKITVLSDDEDYKKEVETSAVSGAESGSEMAEVNENPRTADERTAEKLKAEDPERYRGLTPAKVRLIETVMIYDKTMTYETGAQMTVKELTEMLKDLIEEYKDFVNDELKEGLEAKVEAAVAETERQIAAVYGDEYLAAWEKYRALEAAFESIESKAETVSVSDEDVQAIMELLGVTDVEVLSADGVVTEESVEKYIDKNFDEGKPGNKDEKDRLKQIKRAVEKILDKYDEENYVLTSEDNAALGTAWGETLEFETLEDAEEFVEEQEESLEDLRESIRLTEEQRAQIKALSESLKETKRALVEEMKTEIEQTKEDLRRRKEEILNARGVRENESRE